MKKCLAVVLVMLVITTCSTAQITFYGLTQLGGDSSAGTLFRYDISTGTDTVLHSFGAATDGRMPTGSLLLANNGLLYGLTSAGGVNGTGTLFSYNIGTGAYTDLHDFGSNTDGQTPRGSMMQSSNGLLYGMTEGGGTYSAGTIFTYNPASYAVNVVHNWGTFNDGELPYGSLIEVQDTLLYGMTLRGGYNGSGCIFDYNTLENTDTVLYSFGSNDTDSQNAYGSLVQANGWVYGMTYFGGNDNTGTLVGYYYADTIETDTLLFSFNGSTAGQNPGGSLIAAGNLLYGMTQNGGASDSGVIFSYNISSNSQAVLHNFSGGADGASPFGSLLQASNGFLYGMTQKGGANDQGAIISYNISTGAEQPLYSFGSGTDGASPKGDLIEVDGIPAITGINHVSSASAELSVFPNPSTGQFVLRLTGNQVNCAVDIFDVLGNRIYQSVLSSPQTTIHLDNQPAGMYFINVQSGNEVISAKVLLTR